MSKLHYLPIDDTLSAACGMWGDFTRDPEQVTCLSCRRSTKFTQPKPVAEYLDAELHSTQVWIGHAQRRESGEHNGAKGAYWEALHHAQNVVRVLRAQYDACPAEDVQAVS
jgi:hypothetical protein